MGLSLEFGIGDFLKEANRTNFSGKSILMLGKQSIWFEPMQIYRFAKNMNVEMISGKFRCDAEGHMDSYAFFEALGFDKVLSMDISKYENADIIFDLNDTELPEELNDKFDYILDGGTLEHVFNIPNTLKNIVRMLKIGGKVWHYVPANNDINHGFYQFSPEILSMFYENNGFTIEDCDIVLRNERIFDESTAKCKSPQLLDAFYKTAIDYRILNIRDGCFKQMEGYTAMLHLAARKITNYSDIKTPIQRHWYTSDISDMFVRCYGLDKNNKNTAAIWGAGKTAALFMDILNQNSNYSKDAFVGFFDNDSSKSEFIYLKKLQCSNIQKYHLKVIFIAAVGYEAEICEEIKNTIGQDHIELVSVGKYLN